MPTSITLTGWKEFEDKLQNMPDTLKSEVDGEVWAAVNLWGELAKLAAPNNFGMLVKGIKTKKVEPMWAELTSNALYSPYMEWGTGSRAVIPADLLTYAAQWWTRKIHKGIRAYPFFFVQMPIVEKELFSRVDKILKTEH